MELTLTPHGKQRLKERGGKSTRQLELAIERGKTPEQFSGRFKKYLDYKRITHKHSLIIYDNKIFVYNRDRGLITVVPIPTMYLKCLRKG
jgi:hypothetical protein